VIEPGNNNIIGPSIYGARTFGDFMCDRQTLYYVRLCKTMNEISAELLACGFSHSYARALTGYAAANLVRMLRYSTRGAWFRPSRMCIEHIFVNEGSLTFSYDFFEAGIGDGPGTWNGVRGSSVGTLRDLMPRHDGHAVNVSRGTATALPFGSATYAAVVTDPPYDEMIAYGDSSDIFYVWLRRALVNTWPELSVSSEPGGAQEKALEIIVKRSRGLSNSDYVEHRTREHYDKLLSEAFKEMRRVVRSDGIVTIVFGHGDPIVWQRLLSAIDNAGLIMTGSWPANTESGGSQGKANIETTLTMACRPAPEGRGQGRKGAVESEIRAEIKRRYPDWERWGLAPADMLMAAAGPAMEVVGRYSEVLDAKATPVDIFDFLPLARSAAQEAMAVEVNHQPLESFDARTRFGLWWVRLYGRQPQSKGELRWQTLAASLDVDTVKDLIRDADKGVRFVFSREFSSRISPDSSVIDVALVLAAASSEGAEAMGQVLVASGRSTDDTHLWATIQFLADRLPDNDPDAVAFTRVLRTRAAAGNAATEAGARDNTRRQREEEAQAQLKLL
jgi:putative DNA methylase